MLQKHDNTFSWQLSFPNNSCMVHLPTFSIKETTTHVGKYSHGSLWVCHPKNDPSHLPRAEIRGTTAVSLRAGEGRKLSRLLRSIERPGSCVDNSLM